MKTTRFSLIILILIALLSGCKTTKQIQTQDQVEDSIVIETAPEPIGEFRGFIIQPESWIDEDTEYMIDNIRTLFGKITEANFNVVFFIVRENAETYYPSPFEPWSSRMDNQTPGFDPLHLAVEVAHELDLKIYAGMDLMGVTEENPLVTRGENILNPEFPQLKTYLKNIIRNLTENYNIDGFSFDLSGYPLDHIGMSNPSPEISMQDSLNVREVTAGSEMDLIEDIVVEAMLVKPYLVNSLLLPEEIELHKMNACLKEGIVDFIVPEIEYESKNPDEPFADIWKETAPDDLKMANIFPMILLSDTLERNEITSSMYKSILASGGRGMVMNYKNLSDKKPDINFYQYDEKIDFPYDLKQVTPEQVVGFDVTALFPGNYSGQVITLDQINKTKIADSEGKFGLLATLPDTIELETTKSQVLIPTRFWSIPYKYIVQLDNEIKRESPWVEFRRMPRKFTDDPEFDLLCKTEYPATVRINNDSVKIYKTGVFFKSIVLTEGANRVRATSLTNDSLSVFYEREFVYKKVDKTRKPFPLWVDEKSVEPGSDLELLHEDIIRVSFEGSLGQDGYIAINPGGIYVDCSREDYEDYSLYQAELPLHKLASGNSYKLTLGLTSSADASEISIYKFDLPNSVKVRKLHDFPLVKVVNEHSRLTYNLGPIRLGGPIRSELGPGVIMKTNGKIGENYRIRLNRIENGIIHQDNVEELPDETVQSSYFITNMSCAPAKNGDILSIPYLESVPYMVYPDPDQNRIVITLYGVKTSSTWITHHKGRKIIDKVTWKQTTPETYEVYANLKTPNIWGYNIRQAGSRLILYVKDAPEYNLNNKNPLTGLKIAIEAGHGGENTGAIGLSGLLEKDINLDLSFRLGELCKLMGAEVLQVRDSDKYMSLLEKRDIAVSSGADLLISIHANAAGGGGGYLRVPGTSTYYNNPFWAPLAENIYDRLLELDLEQFGVIGSFNYTGIRISQMPSILVEQAFMSHAEDEEKLADPDFRQKMAQKIVEGIIDYLKYMQK